MVKPRLGGKGLLSSLESDELENYNYLQFLFFSLGNVQPPPPPPLPPTQPPGKGGIVLDQKFWLLPQRAQGAYDMGIQKKHHFLAHDGFPPWPTLLV